jgi:hypothetical protein
MLTVAIDDAILVKYDRINAKIGNAGGCLVIAL